MGPLQYIGIIASISLSCLLVSSGARAASSPSTFTYQGKITNTAGTSPLLDTVTVKVGIYDPGGSCLLYEESQSVNTTSTAGVFSIEVGQTATTGGERTADDPGLTMTTVYANTAAQIRAAGANCAGGYTPTSGDSRKIRLTITPASTGVTAVLSPDQVLNSVPHALVAETLQGYSPLDLILSTGNVTQANLATLTGAGDGSALHHHNSLYVQSGSTASLGNNSNVTGSFGIGTSAPTTDLGFGGNSNRAIGVNRNSTTTGANLTVSSGGAASGGTDLNGGSLVLSSGTATGSGSSSIEFKTASPSSSGTSDNAPTTKMTILGNGNVGIGTTSPGGKLEINHTGAQGSTALIFRRSEMASASNAAIRWQSSDGTNQAGIGTNFNVSDNGALEFINGTTTNMVLRSTGNLGIGTTSPESALHVNTTTDRYSRFGGNDWSLRIGELQAGIQFLSLGVKKTAADNNYIAETGNDGSVQHMIFELDYSGAFRFKGQSHQNDETTLAPTELMTISNSGNVGIGASSPASKLEVLGGASRSVHIGDTGCGANYAGIGFSTMAGCANYSLLGDGSHVYLNRPTGGAMFFRENNTNQMTIDAGGNVGIGTTTPLATLTVGGNQAGNAGFEVVPGSGVVIQSYNRTSSAYSSFSLDGSLIRFRPSGSTAMTVNTNGNVGIGTTSPPTKLSVGTDADSADTIPALGAAGGRFSVTNANAYGLVSGVLSSGNIFQQVQRVDGTATAYDLLLQPSGGNVGIGTTTPAYLLDVNGQAIVRGSRLYMGGTTYYLGSTGETNLYALAMNRSSGAVGFPDIMGGSGGLVLAGTISGAGNISLNTVDNVTPTMYLSSTGNVGIGTNAPNEKLEVNGSIRLTTLNGGGSTTATIDNNGNIIRTPSDERLKMQVEPLTNSLSRLLKLQGVSYYWKNQASYGSAKDIGFIAQDLEKVVPEVVRRSPDSEQLRSVNYANMVALIVESIKEIYHELRASSKEIARFSQNQESRNREIQILKLRNLQLEQRSVELERISRNLTEEVSILKSWICAQPGRRPASCDR